MELEPSAEKWVLALVAGILFVIIASPMLFKGTDYLLEKLKIHVVDASGKPSIVGLLIHGLIFVLLFRVILAMVHGEF